jgi:hypothetical protein
MKEWRITALEPWAANGPGLANRGITADLEGPAYQDADGVIRFSTKHITIYDKDLSLEESLALDIGIMAHCILGKRILNEVGRGCATPAIVSGSIRSLNG